MAAATVAADASHETNSGIRLRKKEDNAEQVVPSKVIDSLFFSLSLRPIRE